MVDVVKIHKSSPSFVGPVTTNQQPYDSVGSIEPNRTSIRPHMTPASTQIKAPFIAMCLQSHANHKQKLNFCVSHINSCDRSRRLFIKTIGQKALTFRALLIKVNANRNSLFSISQGGSGRNSAQGVPRQLEFPRLSERSVREAFLLPSRCLLTCNFNSTRKELRRKSFVQTAL